MTKHVLGVDIDSTIWDFAPAMHEALYGVCGVRCEYEDVTSWSYWFGVAEKEDVVRAFDITLDPEKVWERERYPNASKALMRLQLFHDVEVHFVTHAPRPGIMRIALEPWLKSFYGTRSVLHTCHPSESKLDVLNEIGAFGMIDDRPDFIAEVADEGLWAATKIHPWTRQVAESRDDVFGFEDWSEVVPAVLENLDQNERIPA